MTFEEQRAKKQAAAGKGLSRANEKAAKKFPIFQVILGVALLVCLVFALRVCSSAMTIDVTVNGLPYTLHGAKTIQTAIKESGLPINPGDLISIRGTVLQKSQGYPVAAVVNGREVTNLDEPLHNGDVITLSDGQDIVEEYDSTEDVTYHSARISGAGALHKITPGSDGVVEVRTGKISGEEVRRLRSESSDAICLKYNPEVGDDKVIALTFEQGPSEDYTADILDILKENDAHATFFCVGSEIEKYTDELVQRELSEGHQVGTGTYNFASEADAAKLKDLSTEDLKYQMERGVDALSAAVGDTKATGGKSFSRISRLPGGKVDEKVVGAIDSYVDMNVGWNVDTGDWMESGSDKIYNVLMSLEPGDIVRLHDGGGDHSGTVEALRQALPELREEGYRFVTIEELLEYPAQ